MQRKWQLKSIMKSLSKVGAENCKYEKLINDIVMKKDLFWIAVAEAWWKNQYGGKYNTKGDSNDGIAFG